MTTRSNFTLGAAGSVFTKRVEASRPLLPAVASWSKPINIVTLSVRVATAAKAKADKLKRWLVNDMVQVRLAGRCDPMTEL
jgi:hypothetical protein